MDSIISVKNIGKKYNITHRRGGYIALRDVLTNIAKNPFKFLKYKAKKIAGLETKEEFWALKDINFEVQKGEVVGIIGANGAGKSTLLKILSQITPPTIGEIKIRGRVGSLLEVGTGFHPELTGRENIMLNGAILGMKKNEIIKKFNAIIEFAGIEKFLDTPVKYYSSGMYVRLAFSVAAHMEPDILIVDEVLAVGDAEFQKKCLGKMDEITKKEGRTILFVSHNMEAINSLCAKCLLLEHGQIKTFGETKKIINEYLNLLSNPIHNISLDKKNRIKKATLRAKFTNIFFETNKSQILNILNSAKPVDIKMEIESFCNDNIEATIQIFIGDGMQNIIYIDSAAMRQKNIVLKKGKNIFVCRLEKLPLRAGNYILGCHLTIPNQEIIDHLPEAVFFKVSNDDSSYNGNDRQNGGLVLIDHEWLKK